MSLKRHRRKPDLFSVLLIVLTLGMSVTLAYQINVYYGANAVPIAKQAPSVPAVVDSSAILAYFHPPRVPLGRRHGDGPS